MHVYKLPIELAIIVFPFIAFLFTLPFLFHNYRKYGAIHPLKSIVFYSMILYLITAYFLVILPLPTFTEVRQMTGPTTQLDLFYFIKVIINAMPNNINGLNDILLILKNQGVYTTIFNIFLTLPFGIYLKYYFNKKWYQAIGLSFLLSLFFEVTQLTGLYGIYPRSYRLFDVDDLLINTIGGYIGFLITPILQLFLPTRKELDAKSYEKGKKVTLLRRYLAFLIDLVVIAIISLLFKIIFYNFEIAKYSQVITIVFYYFILPLITNGQTLGKKFIKIKIDSTIGELKWYQLLGRNILLVVFTLYPYIFLQYINFLPNIITDIIGIIIIIYFIVNLVVYIKKDKNKNNLFIYERLTKTKNVSLIEIDTIEEEKQVNNV